MNTDEIYSELQFSLSTSSAADRDKWASIIVQDQVSIRKISSLLFSDSKVSLRFQWLLSDIGTRSKKHLLDELPFLFTLKNEVVQKDFKTAFATYWSISGVPVENEGEAIELLFQWLNASTTNVTTKSRSLSALLVLSKKYPELKNEIRISIENQKDKYTVDFAKKSQKILDKL